MSGEIKTLETSENSEPKNPCCASARNYFREYCSCTSVHGFRYIGDKNRPHFERIWWCIVFILCLGCCVVSIYHVYKKWESSPVIVSFANRGTPIYNVPFPAVTICPESKAVQDKFNYTEILQKKEDNLPLTDSESINFEYMSLICDDYPELNYSKNKTFPDSFYHFMDSIKPDFQIRNCTFLSQYLNCSEHFTPIITDEGVCYSFNILDKTEIYRGEVLYFHENYHANKIALTNWSLEYGYSKTAGIGVYPSRAFLAGAKNGLTFNVITPKKDLDYACKGPLQGYRLSLHTPINIPRPSQKYIRIPLDQSVVGAIQPDVITTSPSIEKYDSARRGCYFQEERYLKYFKNYTLTNCKMECLTNYTLNFCQCVNFYMPRERGTKICGTGSMHCMRETEEIMEMADLELKLEHTKIINSSRNFEMDCKCLPLCSDLNYEVEISQSYLDWKNWMRARRNLPHLNESHMSSLTLFFRSDNFIKSERNELYGPIDFVANFGGLLGLFTGFSVLSLMEILYFLSIRLICNKRMYGRWTGKQD